jgi:hypothetical protein
MKRFLIVFILVLSASGLFAKDKQLYEKKTKVSLLELYETKTESHPYYISAYDWITEDENDWNIIYCDDKQKAQDFILYLRNHNLGGLYNQTIVAYEVFHEELELLNEGRDMKNNKFINISIYLLK